MQLQLHSHKTLNFHCYLVQSKDLKRNTLKKTPNISISKWSEIDVRTIFIQFLKRNNELKRINKFFPIFCSYYKSLAGCGYLLHKKLS